MTTITAKEYTEKQETFQPDLFEPSAYLENNLSSGPGYFGVLEIPDASTKRHTLHSVEHLPFVIESLFGSTDTYISQAVFSSKRRTVNTVKSIGLAFADLDTHNSPDLLPLSPEQQSARLSTFCSDVGLPPPSTVVFSGRGLQPKWLFTQAVNRNRLSEWERVESALVEKLLPFCADRHCKDAARVLRLEKTYNSKSGKLARVVAVEGDLTRPALYDFDDLASRLVLPALQEIPEGDPLEPVGHLHRDQILKFTYSDLAWSRFLDLKDLAVLRQGRLKGMREITLFWMLNFLGRAGVVSEGPQFWREAESLARQIGYLDEYRKSSLSTVYQKVGEHRAGKRTIFNGKMYPALYTPRTSTLLDIFRPTSDEQTFLRAIISTAEKDRRRAAKRWAAGAKPHALSADRTRPWEYFGISRATWFRKGKPLPPSA